MPAVTGENSVLVLTVKPSFDPDLRVELIERWRRAGKTPRTTRYELRSQMRGYFGLDHPRYDPETRMLKWLHRLNADEAARINKLLGAATLALVPPSIMGLDGTTYTLEVDAGSNRVCLRWWSELPQEWSGLAELVGAIMKMADVGAVVKERVNRYEL